MATREDGTPTISAVSGPRPWPKGEPKDRWHIEEEPGGDKRIWMSNKGRILWQAPEPEEAVTFEERTDPEETTGIEEKVRDLENQEDRQWRRIHHCFDAEEDLEVDEELQLKVG